MRAAVRRFRFRWTGLLHALTALAFLLGLLAPLTPGTLAPLPAAAQRAPALPPPLAAPVQVAAVGDFQTALGCPADDDPDCHQSQLDDTGSGMWSVFLPIPPGNYRLRIVARADRDVSLGQGGDPDGADIALDMPNDAAGAYISYDANTGAIVAKPAAHDVELTTDLGDRIAMGPARRGYRATFDAQAGTYGVQILVDGEPVAQDQISLDTPQRVIFETDASGQVTNKDIVPSATLTVTRTGASGAPAPGACFAVTRGNTLVGQACDGDDGQVDGQTRVRFPDGIESNAYDLIETRTPEGQSPAEPQRIDLGPGPNTASVTAPGGQAGEPTAEPPTERPAEPPATAEPPTEQPAIETPGDETVPGRLV
ncbi:MAG: hypothetical protein IT337_13630, partial [Thermomicrobiales bacterium]|nr:hypothetical protein [Thermomicrobiales bacterium]